MLPSMFTLHAPMGPYQVLFSIYAYVLPIVLYAVWATLSLLDLAMRPEARHRAGWGATVLLLPLLGGAAYLLLRAQSLSPRLRYAAVGAGLLVWLVPFTYGLLLVWGPLGPKAL